MRNLPRDVQKQPLAVFYKKSVLKNFVKFTGKHLYQGHLPQACTFIKKDTLVQVFSSEFCEISKNTFFTEHLRASASLYQVRWRCSYTLILIVTLIFQHLQPILVLVEEVRVLFTCILFNPLSLTR